MKYTTVMLAVALLMVPLVSATAMAQMKPMAQTEPAEAGEEAAQALIEAFGQMDIMGAILGGGAGTVLGGGIGAVVGLLNAIYTSACAFCDFSILNALYATMCAPVLGCLGGLLNTRPLIGMRLCLTNLCGGFVDLIDTCCAVGIAWITDVIEFFVGAFVSCCMPLYTLCFDAIDTVCAGIIDIADFCVGALWSLVTPLYALCGAEAFDWLENCLDENCLAILPIGTCLSTVWACVSSCLLGTLSGYLGLFLIWGPIALCCWPIAGAIALIVGLLGACGGGFFGFIGGGCAEFISDGNVLVADLCSPLGMCFGDTMVSAMEAGVTGGILGAIAGAIWGAILGCFSDCLLPCSIPGCFNGGLLGAISGFIEGFGIGTIAASAH